VSDEIVSAFMASLKVTATVALVATPVAPLAGFTDETVGAVVSDAVLVVNVDVKVAVNALAAASLTRGSVVPPTTVSV
jgi:hypothetical protein